MAGEGAKLLLVGCGKMGGALLERAGSGLFAAVRVVDPSLRPPHLKRLANLEWLRVPEQLEPDFAPDLAVIAVKPQHIDGVLPAYARFGQSVFLSIAAGTTLAKLAQLLGGAHHSIVRAMPNLPASIGEGITAATPNAHVTMAQRALCEDFLKSVGELIWLEDEKLLDAVTAYAGVPAFVFALCESVAKAGEALGFSPEMAMRLARQNVIGSGALLKQSAESAEALRRAVTSPGGTTEAALKHILTEHGLDDMILKAMKAGTERAKELAQ